MGVIQQGRRVEPDDDERRGRDIEENVEPDEGNASTSARPRLVVDMDANTVLEDDAGGATKLRKTRRRKIMTGWKWIM